MGENASFPLFLGQNPAETTLKVIVSLKRLSSEHQTNTHPSSLVLSLVLAQASSLKSQYFNFACQLLYSISRIHFVLHAQVSLFLLKRATETSIGSIRIFVEIWSEAEKREK